MAKALDQARRGARKGEVPIGALAVQGSKILAQDHNRTREWRDPTAHAEILVLRAAAKRLDNERLSGLTLYVTLEPCAMCAGAIVQARVPTVVFGAWDAKAGACGSILKVLPNKHLNHRPVVVPEVLAAASARILRGFFKGRRRAIIRDRSLTGSAVLIKPQKRSKT